MSHKINTTSRVSLINKIYSGFFSKFNQMQLMQITTQIAVLSSIIILCIKLYAYKYTCSHALWGMILDSGFDISISLVNYFIIKLISQKITNNMRYSYDKIAGLAAFMQGLILVGIVVSNLFGIGHTHSCENSNYAIIALIISTVLCLFTISVQKYTIGITKSVIIEADMMHYKSDLLANAVIILMLVIGQYAHIAWLDQALGVIIAIYLLKNSIQLIWRNLSILLDRQDTEMLSSVKQMLNENSMEYNNLFVTYSGMRYIITADIIFQQEESLEKISNVISQAKHKITHLLPNQLCLIKLTPVNVYAPDIDLVDPSKISCCHGHAH